MGGSVRDLLLGRKVVDLDIVVEGDGITFAQELAGIGDRDLVPYSRFGTAFVILPPGIKVDIATARRESYPEPGLLPDIEPASLDEDLSRRDFTINAMAIRLGPAGYGTFLDQHEGCRDLCAGIIRVLHEGSFRDDPTRILRAIRFKARLGYSLDVSTVDLLVQSVKSGMLEAVSRQRIRDEIVLILTEDDASNSLAYLSDMGIWNSLFKYDLKVPAAAEKLFREGEYALQWYHDLAQKHDLAEVERWAVRWLLLAGNSTVDTFIRISSDFHMGQAVARAAGERADNYPKAHAILFDDSSRASHRTDSTLFWALALLGPVSIVLLASHGGHNTRIRLADYFTRLREIVPFVDGNDLKSMQIPEGPRLGEILREVLSAQIDGKVLNRSDALDLARHLAGPSGKGR
ncbi:CCA tRNA nucleotidyltransferase [Gemmatimonadota bacterium]